MFRRVVSILLLPCLLLTQSAALGHGHGEGLPAGHGLRPHFHSDAPPARHSHPHTLHHNDGERHHHHYDDGDENQHQPAPPPSPGTPPTSDHDRDAVFIDAVDAFAQGRSAIEHEAAGWSLLLAFDLSLPNGSSSGPSRVHAGLAHPPPAACACPLYVRHLTLLI